MSNEVVEKKGKGKGKGRGRPQNRVIIDEVDNTNLDDEKDTVVKSVLTDREDEKDTVVKSVLTDREHENGEPAVKRGRGRPPKGTTAKPKPVPSGLPRGRPTKKVQYNEEITASEESDNSEKD